MKLLFTIMYLFFFFFFKFGLCDKSDSMNKFYFNDIKSTKDQMIAGSKALYPLMKDLEENDDYSNIDNTYDEISFPNPFVQPEECVLSLGISHSWLCDPSRFLNIDEQLNVEATLLKIRDTNFHKCSNNGIYYYQVSVALVPQILIDKNSSYEKSAQKFSQNLLRKWGIGNKECHDGILLVYIKQLGKFIVAKREGVEDQYINENEIRMHFINTYFATGSLSKALIESLNFINKKLPSKPQELTNTAKMFLLLILFYIVSIIILYITTVTYSKNI
ncbi:conserved Plasmodium protein, unknown function [Plasmodium relictum]|uniref:MOLO1 domain-containing protein n=1 Tax=Plasmodium relictum TaxID=85471 RepID=A0A1J1H6S9_PLARL|nr:conserved Plasmodium protein, unknown function [Plasmodium relictum]CRH00624.1 conserved Plasmodium protein, unknown function [Plasmodium relictum]